MLVGIVGLLVAAACANRGSGPQGGPKDVTPPRLLKTTPPDNALNVKSSTVELQFDEIVQLESPFDKVVISPPQTTPAEIKALGHKVKVVLKDSLLDSTTYTIDFTDAIVDNNERNRLQGLSLGFSTGDHIDTLEMAGTVIDAETLNPVPGIVVGINNNLHDTAFTTTPFRRITKTNEKGQFRVSNIAHGSYRIFALADMGNNYRFDIPTERIAFLDSIYTPSALVEMHIDTIGSFAVDSVTGAVDSTHFVIDTIVPHYVTTFTPTDIILKSFVEKDHRHYLTRNERKEANRFSLIFSSPCDTLPTIKALNLPDSSFTFLLQKSVNADTLTYWLTDTSAINTDTLRCAVDYFRIDLDTQYHTSDTLDIVYRRPKSSASTGKSQRHGTRKAEKAEDKVPSLALKHNASAKFDINVPLTITLPIPSVVNDTAHYSLQIKKDTVYTPVDAVIVPSDSIGLAFRIDFDWQAATSYRLSLDSAYFIALDSTVTIKQNIDFTTKSLEEYGKLIFKIINYQNCEVIQLINKNDVVVRSVPTTSATTTIEYLAPDVYYARLFLDRNHNGIWDTGSYSGRMQAEEVYYFPYEIELRAFWDVEEEWDINELPLTRQKPAALVKPLGK